MFPFQFTPQIAFSRKNIQQWKNNHHIIQYTPENTQSKMNSWTYPTLPWFFLYTLQLVTVLLFNDAAYYCFEEEYIHLRLRIEKKGLLLAKPAAIAPPARWFQVRLKFMHDLIM